MKKYIISVLTDFGRDGHGERGYHEVEVIATSDEIAISAAESIVISEAEPGTVILEFCIMGYYEVAKRIRIKHDVTFKRLRPRRIRMDVYTVYCNPRTSTYSLYALGTTVPRQAEELTDIIKILHSLVYYKYKELPGSMTGKPPRVLHYRYKGGAYA